MSVHLERELDRLKKMVLEEGALVEEAIDRAIRAFHMRDSGLAREVIRGDAEIDLKEMEVEEECLKLLALYAPMAADLRFVVAVLKLNNDLERMGDLASNLGRRAKFLARVPAVDTPADLVVMGDKVRQMVKQSLDSLVNHDLDLARAVCAQDDAVDLLKRQIKEELRQRLVEQPDNINTYLKLMDVPRHLERIADLATNVAEDVIYMISGEIVRHQRAEHMHVDVDEDVPSSVNV